MVTTFLRRRKNMLWDSIFKGEIGMEHLPRAVKKFADDPDIHHLDRELIKNMAEQGLFTWLQLGAFHKLCWPKMGGPDLPSYLCQPMSAFPWPPLPPLSVMSAFAHPLPLFRVSFVSIYITTFSLNDHLKKKEIQYLTKIITIVRWV